MVMLSMRRRVKRQTSHYKSRQADILYHAICWRGRLMLTSPREMPGAGYLRSQSQRCQRSLMKPAWKLRVEAKLPVQLTLTLDCINSNSRFC